MLAQQPQKELTCMLMRSQSFHERPHSPSFDSPIGVDRDLRGIIIRSQVPRFAISVGSLNIMPRGISSKKLLELRTGVLSPWG